jgi:hypothetical protein
MPITNNKNGKNDKADKSHLDKLLENKPPEFQASVLRFALDSGMREDDPAFRLVQYIGYLSQLTETAPTEWKQLFKKLQGELSEWTELTAEQLATAADQSETINNLAQSSNRLSFALNALDLTSQQQLQQLTALSEISPSLRNVVEEMPTLKKLLTHLNQTLSQNQILRAELSQSQMAELKREISIALVSSRKLDLMQMNIGNLLENQRLMMSKMKQLTEKEKENEKIDSTSILGRILSRFGSKILTWICRIDLQVISVVAIALIFIFIPIALISRMNADPQPALSLEAVGRQVHNTYLQVNSANLRLERIEKSLGTQPKPKPKPS